MNPRDLTLSNAVEGFILHKQAENLSHNTIRNYRNALRKFARFVEGDPPIADLTTADHVAFFEHLATTPICPGGAAPRPPIILSPKTRRNIHACLSSFWKWARNGGFIDRVPIETLKPPRAEKPPIEPLTEDEIKKMLSACEVTREWYNKPGTVHRRPLAARDKAIVLFLYDTGVRASEACGLDIGNVDLNVGRALVTGKRNKSRYVRIGKRCRQALWRYLSTRESKLPDDPLFVVYRYDMERPMRRKILGRLLKRLGKRAGIDNVYPHRMRHTFAIQYLRKGGDIYTLQELLGHTSLDMVKRYLKIAEADTARVHRRASPADHL